MPKSLHNILSQTQRSHGKESIRIAPLHLSGWSRHAESSGTASQDYCAR
jgi:hypothetical protein